MKPTAPILAAARCWELAGEPERAAERYAAVGDHRGVGRCLAAAGRFAAAALAFEEAEDWGEAARQWRQSPWPERAAACWRRQLQRCQQQEGVMGAEEVEALAGLGQLELAWRRAQGPGSANTRQALARLCAARQRPDLAARLFAQLENATTSNVAVAWQRAAPWNHALCWRPPAVGKPKTWPEFDFRGVRLTQVWHEATGHWRNGGHALHWSADGRKFVAALGVAGLAWGVLTQSGVRLQKHRPLPWNVFCVCFEPNSAGVLVGLGSGEVWQVLDGGATLLPALEMPKHVVNGIAFDPQGASLAITSWANPGARLKVWAWQQGQPGANLMDFAYSEGNPLHVAFAPDGQSLAFCGLARIGIHDYHGLVRRADAFCTTSRSAALTESKRQKQARVGKSTRWAIPTAHTSWITSLSFTPDGSWLLSAGWDGQLILRAAANGQDVAPPVSFRSGVEGAAVHPRVGLVAVGTRRVIHLLRLQLGATPRFEPFAQQELERQVQSLAFSPDGRHLLVMTGEFPGPGHLHLFRVELLP